MTSPSLFSHLSSLLHWKQSGPFTDTVVVVDLIRPFQIQYSAQASINECLIGCNLLWSLYYQFVCSDAHYIAHFKITKKKLNEQCVIGMPDTADWILKCQFDRELKIE